MFSVYLNGDKLVDDVVIDFGGMTAINVETKGGDESDFCYWLEFKSCGLKPLKLVAGDEFHLCAAPTTDENFYYCSSCNETGPEGQEAVFKSGAQKSQYSQSYTNQDIGHFPFLLYAKY